MKRLTLAATLALANCAATNPNAGHWVGSANPTTSGPTCEKSRATLEVASDGKLQFAPTEGTWILVGALAEDGSIIATRTQPGVDKKPFATRLDAKIAADAVTGTYATPRCRFAISLKHAR